MGNLLQRVLIRRIFIGGAAAALAGMALARLAPPSWPLVSCGGATTGKSAFRPDDPLLSEPKPLAVGKLRTDKLSDAGDFIHDTLHLPGEKQSKRDPTPSLDTNTLDEAPNGSWYTNRHYFHRMTAEELFRGIDGTKPPSTDGPWEIYEAKLEGVTPGFRIRDSRGEKYVIKFDPLDYPEMATGADVVGARILICHRVQRPGQLSRPLSPEPASSR